MKLSNIFKKNTKVVAIANVEKIDKKQLEKVVGGTDTISTTTTVSKQTPSTPFGEKVQSGLAQTGSALANGAV